MGRSLKMNEQRKPFASLGYEPVGPIVTRLLARYLRTQRKNMRRFFQERNLFELADRMNQIRKSRQGMLAKNRYFQQVLHEYAKLTTPPVVASHVPGVPEAAGEPAQDIVIDET
jgi:hypothetical protein